jgi:hypothetical protein
MAWAENVSHIPENYERALQKAPDKSPAAGAHQMRGTLSVGDYADSVTFNPTSSRRMTQGDY